MRENQCEKSVSAKVVLLDGEESWCLKIDEDVLTTVIGASVDENTIADRLLNLQNLTVTFTTDAMMITDIVI